LPHPFLGFAQVPSTYTFLFVEQSNVFSCIWHIARVENVINISVACLGLQCPANGVPLFVVFQYSKRCLVTIDPLLEFENKISYLGGKWCVATSMTPWCHRSRCRGLCHGVRSKTNDSKFLKFGYDGEILPISVNRVAFIILHEDKCVKQRITYEPLIAMA
jgi:hypothetical protein